MIRRWILLVASGSLGAWAQLPPLAGPVEGFTFDSPTGSFRAVLGTLGSASLGPALGAELDFGSVAPGGKHALAFQGDRPLLVTGLGAAEMSIVSLPGDLPVADTVAWSGDSSVAILYSRKENRIQILRGLPDVPSAGPPLSISPLGGTLSAVTTDFRGEHIAIGVSGDLGGVFEITSDFNFVPLLPVAAPVALAFSEDGSALYTLDGGSRQLWEWKRPSATSEAWQLDGMEDPVALRFTRNAQRPVLYVAGRRDRLLLTYDPATRQVTDTLALDFEPAILEPLGRDSFWLALRARDGDLLWSFSSARRPAISFVPATPLSGEEASR